MTDHFKNIYANQAEQYDLMVSREDYQGNILKALNGIRPMRDMEVVEFGAGTGRLTRLLAPSVKSIRAYDESRAMLAVAGKSLKKLNVQNYALAVGDNRNLPVDDNSADVTIEGWSFGHFQGWYPDTWRDETDKALSEMARILRPGGVAILMETMTTGSETPAPPTDGLANLYAYWEGKHAFQYQWIRTDYQFNSVQEASDLTRFFFGDDLADRIEKEQMTILPECTGIWWKTME